MKIAIALTTVILSSSATAQSQNRDIEPLRGRFLCAEAVEDQAAAGNCLQASTVPTLGMLYPLSSDFFIDPSTGFVGVGTTVPEYALRVNGQAISGVGSVASGIISTVSGGQGNVASGVQSTISGGRDNQADGPTSVIGGGFSNRAGTASTVSGGFGNEAIFGATVGGGANNMALGQNSAIGGGGSGTASGTYATIPGGRNNTADGAYSFAAGLNAHALHDGAFVWSGTISTLDSTAPDQFLIDSPGGVGIGTSTPDVALDVVGAIEATSRISTLNPDNPLASVHLSWLDDVARLRIGGSGAGAQNGFDIQTVSNNSLMRITGAGNVGIGTTSPGSRLDVAGVVRATGYITTSDARLKTDIRDLDGALDKVRALRGVSFDWDRERRPAAEEARQLGFLAQEVQAILPDVVREDGDGTLAVAYSQIVPLLVEALQEQVEAFELLEDRVAELEAENRELRR